tara:strand:- start:304 stop:1068 length:765 start_codon:yes stop_codon:yes gene_type:complete
MAELKTILVTQARSGSTRLPGKILKEIKGKSLLQIHLERLKKCNNISEIIVATTTRSEDKIIYDKSIQWGFISTRGSENDVLDRFYQAVKDKKADWIVRVTSDCPLLDPELVDAIVNFAQNNSYDYVSNGLVEHFPDGQDVEVFKYTALKKAWQNAKLLSEREHVSPYIINNSNGKGIDLYTAINYPSVSDFSKIRMTVDETEDFKLIKILIEKLGIKKSWMDYTNYIIDNDLGEINNKIIRNEGLLKSLKKDK